MWKTVIWSCSVTAEIGKTAIQCRWGCWIRMRRCWTSQRPFTWTSMPPKVCRMSSKRTSDPRALLKCKSVCFCFVFFFNYSTYISPLFGVLKLILWSLLGLLVELVILNSPRMATRFWKRWLVFFFFFNIRIHRFFGLKCYCCGIRILQFLVLLFGWLSNILNLLASPFVLLKTL